MIKLALKPTRRHLVGTGAVVAFALAGGMSAAAAEDFTVGVIGSLTGPAASFDIAVVDGVKAATKYWNDKGGYKGRKVDMRVFDDESQPPTAVTVYRRLTDDPKVSVVMAASPSPSLVAIKAIADEFKTPTTGTATLEGLANPPAKYFFRTLPSANSYMRSMMNWVKARGFKKIAALNPSDVTGQSEGGILKTLAAEMGIELVSESYNNTDTNFTAQLVNIRNANPDFFYAGVIGGPAVLVFKQIKQLKLTMPVAVHSSSFNQGFYTGIGGKEQIEGIYTPIERGALGATATGVSAELFKVASENLGHPATNLNTAGFDTGIIVMDAVNKSDGTRDGIRNAIESLNDLKVIGGLASYSPTNHGGKDERSIAVGQMVKGDFVEAK